MSRIIQIPFDFTKNSRENLLQYLRNREVYPESPCGGNGTCGKCKVLVDGHEQLACRTEVVAGMVVEVPDWESTVSSGCVAGNRDGEVQITMQELAEGTLGVGVDLGTTTISMGLYHLETGNLLAREDAWNRQRTYGGDVVTRMQYEMDHPTGLGELNRVLGLQLRKMEEKLVQQVGSTQGQIRKRVIAGNTVMEHFFKGISTRKIAVHPFMPDTLFQEESEASEKVFPCVSGYFGGDLIAGMLATKLWQQKKKILFLDIGTNGEMALKTEDTIFCCAVASGPAFEGAGIRYGMPGLKGAISHAEWEETLKVTVIGDGPAKGICGSGLLDLVAALRKKGLLEESGFLQFDPACYGSATDEEENYFYITEKICLTGRDIRQLQLAKAAVMAGVQILLKEAGITADEVDEVWMAGGFGCHLRSESAFAINMLPKGLEGKVKSVGNTSFQGAGELLLYPEREEALKKIIRQCRYLELSNYPTFNDIFVESMLF